MAESRARSAVGCEQQHGLADFEPMLLARNKGDVASGAALESRVCYVLGTATAIPVAYPSEPFYWFALIVAIFGIAAARPPRERVVLLFVYLAIGAVSTIITEYQHLASLTRSLPIALGSVLVISGFGFQDRESFIRGYCYMMTVLAILIIFAYIQLGIFSDTWQTFVYPEKRLWGEPYFPDWPNFLAFGLGLAAVIAVAVLRQNTIGALCLAASILTTSRMALVALVVVSIIWTRNIIRQHGILASLTILFSVLISIGLILWEYAVAVVDTFDVLYSSGYVDRLLKLGDRSTIWSRSFEIFAQHPLLGIGAVPLDETIGLPSSSIHNSYLEVTLRFGILGLVAWLFLFLPSFRSLKKHKGLIAVFLFIAVSAFFNNVLKHPHYLVLYGVLLAIGTMGSAVETESRRTSDDQTKHNDMSA